MSKYKYYFKKPRGEITKDILKWILASTAIYVSLNSPNVVLNLSKEFKKRSSKKYKNKNVYDTFYRLRKKGVIGIEKHKNQIYIKLTKEGKIMANWMQIDELKISKPKKWDKKWRIVFFDIPNLKGLYRNVFRGKLKELGFYQLQKSVWITPYNCKDEINLLKDFLGLSDKEIRLVISSDVGNDKKIKRKFNL